MLNIRNLHLYKLNISFITFLYFFFYHYISFIIISFSSLNSIYLSIKINKLSFIVNFLKFNSYFKSTSLMDITVVDYPENTANRFEVSYVLLNYKYNFRFIIRLYTNGITPIASLTNIFNSSNWLEREIWDMFGLRFISHPDLRRILTDYGFKGHPLRKDFPLIGFFEIYYDDADQYFVFIPSQFSQEIRIFNFEGPWNRIKSYL